MKHSLLTSALVLMSLLVASSGLAAPRPPKIVLQPSDFLPAKAQVTVSGPAGKGSGFATYKYRTRTRPMELSVSVATLPSVQMAEAFFLEMKTDEVSFPGQVEIDLPKKYGDEQFANFGGAGSSLIVRKNRVVWLIVLQTAVARGPKWVHTKAQATAEYKTYAPKQQRRVGNG